MRLFILTMVFGVSLACGGGDGSRAKTSVKKSQEKKASASPLPEFRIAKDYQKVAGNRTVEVIINDRLSKAELKRIALHIKAFEKRAWLNTFIYYGLSSSIVNNEGSWYALTNFNSGFNITLVGFAKDNLAKIMLKIDAKGFLGKLDLDTMTSEKIDFPANDFSEREIIGDWLHKRNGHRLSLFKMGNDIYMARIHPNKGEGHFKYLNEIQKDGEFYREKDNRYDYYRIKLDGNLECWSEDRDVRTRDDGTSEVFSKSLMYYTASKTK